MHGYTSSYSFRCVQHQTIARSSTILCFRYTIYEDKHTREYGHSLLVARPLPLATEDLDEEVVGLVVVALRRHARVRHPHHGYRHATTVTTLRAARLQALGRWVRRGGEGPG
jgi:hypothetical protein